MLFLIHQKNHIKNTISKQTQNLTNSGLIIHSVQGVSQLPHKITYFTTNPKPFKNPLQNHPQNAKNGHVLNHDRVKRGRSFCYIELPYQIFGFYLLYTYRDPIWFHMTSDPKLHGKKAILAVFQSLQCVCPLKSRF